jgi:hypothetical protein
VGGGFVQGYIEGLHLRELATIREEREEMFNACMLGKGYQLQPVEP